MAKLLATMAAHVHIPLVIFIPCGVLSTIAMTNAFWNLTNILAHGSRGGLLRSRNARNCTYYSVKILRYQDRLVLQHLQKSSLEPGQPDILHYRYRKRHHSRAKAFGELRHRLPLLASPQTKNLSCKVKRWVALRKSCSKISHSRCDDTDAQLMALRENHATDDIRCD